GVGRVGTGMIPDGDMWYVAGAGSTGGGGGQERPGSRPGSARRRGPAVPGGARVRPVRGGQAAETPVDRARVRPRRERRRRRPAAPDRRLARRHRRVVTPVRAG